MSYILMHSLETANREQERAERPDILLTPRTTQTHEELSIAEVQGAAAADVPERHKNTRSRTGYAPEIGHSLFDACPVDQFIGAAEPVQILASWNKIDLKTSASGAVLKAVNSCPATTDEIRTLCDDLKVLSKSDFKLLLRWRQKLEDLLKPESYPLAGDTLGHLQNHLQGGPLTPELSLIHI
eukprot:TRINITY_DN7120_c0_g2_i1.p1 TRINITY_DN7120_c0_g2~~TRINITY_DN7120_c0_g2_i1.p1  ORF type:complete len:183 (-),score=40.30 TRINITY_DN7120_c0_g2_i1:4-552(-)